jgi:hypothetical protein
MLEYLFETTVTYKNKVETNYEAQIPINPS